MLYSIQKTFFKLKLVRISAKNIEKWMETKQVLKLEYALQYGNYLIRKLAAEALGKLGEKSTIPLLFEATEDPVKIVSIAALNALDEIGFEDDFASTIIKKNVFIGLK